MTAVYKRLKVEPFGQMVRMAKVLRVDGKLRARIRYKWVTRTVAPIGNALLSATASFQPRVDRTLNISLQEGKCGKEFDGLAERAGIRFDFSVRRSADYLNWRYLENPCKKHGLMKAERDGELLGFVVFSQTGFDGEIVDLFAKDDSAILGRLINEVVDLFRRRGAMGYWGQPELTARVLRPHPFSPPELGNEEKVCYSGDLVKMDEDGFLYFVGRRDNMIKCSGYRVSPTEVEEVLFQSGKVREAGVIGIPDVVLGQAIKAYVVPRDGESMNAEALQSFCAERMPRYMVPKIVEVRESLPKTPSGKVDYPALRRDSGS